MIEIQPGHLLQELLQGNLESSFSTLAEIEPSALPWGALPWGLREFPTIEELLRILEIPVNPLIAALDEDFGLFDRTLYLAALQQTNCSYSPAVQEIYRRAFLRQVKLTPPVDGIHTLDRQVFVLLEMSSSTCRIGALLRSCGLTPSRIEDALREFLARNSLR